MPRSLARRGAWMAALLLNLAAGSTAGADANGQDSSSHAEELAIIAPGPGRPGAADQTILYHRPSGKTLVDSRYGALADLQASLLKSAASCGMPDLGVKVDGRYGERTSMLLRDVARCRHITLGDASGNTVTADLWMSLVPGIAPPNASRRAWAMSFYFEGTEYTVVEFNIGSPDPGIMTWGPLGATAGQAYQIQRILGEIDRVRPSLIDQAFGSEAAQARLFMKDRTDKSATAFVTAMHADAGRRRIWIEGFATLGRDREARGIYDNMMAASSTAGIPEVIADFYRAYWSHCIAPTEVDYGFFFDRAVQMNVNRKLVEAADILVQRAEQQAGHKFAPSERRRAFAANFIPGNSHYVGDRLGRDVGYYIDALGPAALTDASLLSLRFASPKAPPSLNSEYSRWADRSGFKASYYGLSDEREMAPPAGLLPIMPGCIAAKARASGR